MLSGAMILGEMESEAKYPYFKLLRVIELIAAIAVIVLWSLNDFNEEKDFETQHAVFIFVYATSGGFTFIFLVDVISQLAADPMDYTPMFLMLLTSAVLHLGSAIFVYILNAYHYFNYDVINILVITFSCAICLICIIDLIFLVKRINGYP